MRKLLLAVLLCIPVVCQAWWDDGWEYRKNITFDLSATGANIPGGLQDAPMLIRLDTGNFGYFGNTNPDGSDLRFVDGDDKTPLKFHIERFDAMNQIALIWVRVPHLAGATAGQKIYLYYGNAKAHGAADASGTYDAHEALVLHFSDPQVRDATTYGNQPASSTAELTPASLIAGGLKLNGMQAVTVPASNSLRLTPAQGATMSTWMRMDATQSDAYLLALQEGSAQFLIGVRGARAYTRLAGAAGQTEVSQSTDLASGAWHHLAASYASGQLILYVDGAAVGMSPVQTAPIGGQLTIGAGSDHAHGFSGQMDEVEFSDVARSADWVAAAARSQGVMAALVGYGGDEQRQAQKVSYFRVTLQNVTADGWIVIGLLLVMFVIAVFVMVVKAIYLTQVRGGNVRFLREFERLRGDPTALDRPESEDGDAALDASPLMPHIEGAADRFTMSTIYRLYHHGVQELQGRVAARSASARAVGTISLTPQAVAAMRATLDATLVRMTQRLSGGMVLLTIAIAGGPFLGLLGTVVGVMITFAAIAASGDVNVNSIAPGIAAALVATVAGLGVAIPSLFGYNWLNTRIKEINADMRVFVDEFVTRVAEHYAD